MQKQLTIAVTAACLALGASAWAQDPRVKSFERTDTNKDGVVSREEYRDRMVEVFYSADNNRDGYLDIDELGDPDPDLLKEADEDRDQRIHLREFLNRRALDFNAADLNADDVISSEENLEL